MLNRFLIIFLMSASLLHAETPAQPLAVGDKIPDVTLRTEDDKAVSLRQLVSEKPTVLIFYRGGWCPYCNVHLQSLVGIEKDLDKIGVQLLAISMDQPSKLRATPHREKLGYRLLSDSDAAAVTAFGIGYKVDDALLEKMKAHNVDLDAATGNNRHILPNPAVFVVTKTGIIRFAHVNPDIKVRLAPAKILEAAQAAVN
jgi:peroxiredoxin